MKIEILGDEYQVIDVKEKITVADSFVVRANKIGGGNGEAKLYVGNDNETIRDFFGGKEFRLSAFLLKKDLIKYLKETSIEYSNPVQPYINKVKMPKFLEERTLEVNSLPDIINFEVNEQTQIRGPRVYVKSESIGYELIRNLSLPNITYIAIVKLQGSDGNVKYYFRLFADYFGEVDHPYLIQREDAEVASLEDGNAKEIVSKARVGQGKYRKDLLMQCPLCPITMVSDERLLIASHIKPWAKSDAVERIDPYNGFMLTPTFDLLFDRGFMSFTDDKKVILSPFLSPMTYSQLKISNDRYLTHLPIVGRENYLVYHRAEILKGV